MKTQIIQALRISLLVFILFCVGNTISMFSYCFGRVVVACASCAITFFTQIGDLLKNHIFVLALWILVLSQLKHRSLWDLVQHATAPLVWGQRDCSICLAERCDYSLSCGHTYHWTCLQKWLKKNNTCPNCRVIVDSRGKLRHKMTVQLLQRLWAVSPFKCVLMVAALLLMMLRYNGMI